MDFRHIANFINSPDSIEDLQASSPLSEDDVIHIKTERPVCCGCRAVIGDRWMLHAGNQPFHLSCLRCSVCLFTLDKHSSCFIRDGNIYCKYHYSREFGTRCAACDDVLEATDWVRYVRNHVFHVHCFTCSACGMELTTGEEFLLQHSRLLCRAHGFLRMPSKTEDQDRQSVSGESDSSGGPRKRARSNFTKDQLAILQSHFNFDPNPSASDVDSLAELTGHPYRVIQIWFQNTRARNKKTRPYKMKPGTNDHMTATSPWSSDVNSPESQNSLSD